MSAKKYRLEMDDMIVQYGKEGCSRSMAASKLGISRRLLFDWSSSPQKYPSFCAAYEQFETELAAYQDTIMKDVGEGKIKLGPGGAAVLIYRTKVMNHKFPEYRADQSKEIKTERVPPQEEVKKGIKDLLEIARLGRESATRPESGESNSGTAAQAVRVSAITKKA